MPVAIRSDIGRCRNKEKSLWRSRIRFIGGHALERGETPRFPFAEEHRETPHCRTGRRMHSDRLISCPEPCPFTFHPAPPPGERQASGITRAAAGRGTSPRTTSNAIWRITCAPALGKIQTFRFFAVLLFGDCARPARAFRSSPFRGRARYLGIMAPGTSETGVVLFQRNYEFSLEIEWRGRGWNCVHLFLRVVDDGSRSYWVANREVYRVYHTLWNVSLSSRMYHTRRRASKRILLLSEFNSRATLVWSTISQDRKRVGIPLFPE